MARGEAPSETCTAKHTRTRSTPRVLELFRTRRWKPPSPSQAQAACVWIGAEHEQIGGLARMPVVGLAHAAHPSPGSSLRSQPQVTEKRSARSLSGSGRACCSVACVSLLVWQTRKTQLGRRSAKKLAARIATPLQFCQVSAFCASLFSPPKRQKRQPWQGHRRFLNLGLSPLSSSCL